MGRSVMTHPHSVTTVTNYMQYQHYNEEADEFVTSDCTYDCYHGDEWEWLIENTRNEILEMFPSMYPVNEWEHGECLILAKNSIAKVSFSEYCDTYVIELVPMTDDDNYIHNHEALFNLGTQWIKNVTPKFEQHFKITEYE